jgi:SAM-dependent methyltransferase
MKSCHMCKSGNLEKFLDLGFHPHSDSFLTVEEIEKPEMSYPLSVFLCRDCGLIQLGFIVDGETLYQKNYIYLSSVTETGKSHYFGLSKDVCERFDFSKESLVIDIGSNVGVLLMGFKEQGMKVLGVDPSPNIAKIAVEENGVDTIPDFFTTTLAKKVVEEKGQASAIMATNIFAHLSDLHDAMEGISILLKNDGVFVIEAPYLVDLIKNLEYDTIYHQHLRYLSVKPMASFFANYGMEIFDVEKVSIHGGSIRVFAGRKGERPVSANVKKFLDLEEEEQVYSMERLKRFANDVREHKRKLNQLLEGLKQDGKKIVGVSAPAKGNTLLNYCGINNDVLDYLTEKSKLKQGLFTPGTHIPIYADEKLTEDNSDYALILAWNFADEIIRNLDAYKQKGGKFIIPIPTPRIVE